MSTQAIDYDALAQQHGAAPAPVDYDALASQHGGSVGSKEPTPENEGFWHSVGSVFGLTPEAYQAAQKKAAGMSPLREALSATAPPNPVTLAKNVASSVSNEFQKGSQEGKQSYDSLSHGDLAGFIAHQIGQVGHAGAAVLAPVTGENLSKAGEQFGAGNVKGGLGTTTGLLAPTILPEAPGAVRATGRGLETAAPYIGKGAKEAARFGGIGEFIHTGNPVALAGPAVADLVGKGATQATSWLGRFLQKAGGADLSPAVLQAESEAKAVSGEPSPSPYRLSGKQIQDAITVTPRAPFQPKALLAEKAGTAADVAKSSFNAIQASPEAISSSGPSTVPRVASGEGVLNQALTSLDNKSLIKVARSRGINVTQEAQLKPGAANSRIISKIIDDFTPEELDEIRNMGMEISRNVPVQNPNVTPEAAAEAWHYKVLNQFFPDVAVPKTMAARAQATIANRPMSPREQAFYAQAASEAKAVPSDAPQYAYRVRDAGETGITPKGSHAQATLDQAQATNPDFIQGRQAAQNHPQEVVRVDLSKLDPKDYEIIKQNGQQWVKFKSSVPEAVIEKMPAQSTQDWSIENMQKQIMLNRFKAKAAKAGD